MPICFLSDCKIEAWVSGCHFEHCMMLLCFYTEPVIAFRNFFKPRYKPVPRLRMPRPGRFVLIRGAEEERIEATYDETGKRMIRLTVWTRSR
jgi:hypothetical protein